MGSMLFMLGAVVPFVVVLLGLVFALAVRAD